MKRNNTNADVKSPLIDLEVGNTTTGGKQLKNVQPERLSEENDKYSLYWIHLKDQNDYLNEGYIGITKNFNKRLKDHRKNKKFKDIWEGLVKEILFDNLSLTEALNLENKYRPFQNIGWNSQKGGEIGVEPEWYLIEKNKLRHSKATSIATKKGILKKDSKENRSLRAKKARLTLTNFNNNKGSNNPRAKLTESQVLDIKTNYLNKGLTLLDIAKIFGVSKYIIWSIKSGKNWTNVICDSPDYSG